MSLPDRYRVVRHIANGGMASVWEAHDELLARRVAVKVLASHLGEDDRARRRFAREARTAAGLSSHPNVVTIYDVGEHDGKSFIVMELVSGGTVADRLRAGEQIPHRVALRWLTDAGSALDAAHEAGIVHRDVKPANMLLDERGRLALADFGIARLGLEDQITQTGQVLGTAAYISPEQAMGEPATAASDRYSLAVVAFELLTGSKPFTAENFAAQARAHVEDEPPRASDLDVDVPAAADGVLARGMAKEPADRWKSAGAMVRALDDALSAPPPRRRAGAAAATDPTRVLGDRTPPPARPAAASRSPRRGWGVGALLGLAALLLLVAGAVALMSGGGDDPGTERGARDEPRATATPGETATPEQTETATPDATAEPPPPEEQQPGNGNGKGKGKGKEKKSDEVAGGDAGALQLQAYELNNSGRPDEALGYAEQAVELCKGSNAVSPCAYALFEYARALRMTGKPDEAIKVLEERQERFPDDQPDAVERELALAREAAGDGDD
jgi:hypothetical protein